MNFTLFIGFVAATMTTIAFAPQAIKVIKTKHTKDISLGMFCLMTGGIAVWLIYGILLRDAAIIFANVVSIILSAIVLTYKVKYK